MKRIILASQSPRRSELLRQIGLPFTARPSGLTENIGAIEGTPEHKAEQLALMKARDVASKVGDELIIGADTIVVLDDNIMGKPLDNDDAAIMLRSLSSRQHKVITGIAVIDALTGMTQLDHETTLVSFRNLTEDIIQKYIATGEPLGKAGAYAIQGIGAILVDKIDGCYSNVVGLPLSKLNSMLEKFQVFVL